MAERPMSVLVAGGGITGLACARHLQDRLAMLGRPFEVTLVEASPRLGGIIETVKRNDYVLEKGPDAFLADKQRGMAFCKELAITNLVIETQPRFRRSFILFKGKPRPIPAGFHLLAPTEPMSMMATSLLSLKAKFRLFKEPLIPPLAGSADETLGAFVRRRFGPEVLERLAQPIINGIYGADPEALSLRATFPQFLEMEKEGSLLLQGLKDQGGSATAQASGARYALMASFKNGMQTLVDELLKKLTRVRIMTGTSVTQLEGAGHGWNVTLSTGQVVAVAAVVLALPAEGAAAAIENTDANLAQLLRTIPHADSLSTYLAFKSKAIGRPVDGVGLLAPAVEQRSFTACTFVHQKFADRVPIGHSLLRVFAGGKKASTLWGLKDDEIAKRFFLELKPVLQFRDSPVLVETFRHRKAMPHYTLGHLERIEMIRQRLDALPTLGLAGNWRNGLGVPDCIHAGERAADQVITDLCRV